MRNWMKFGFVAIAVFALSSAAFAESLDFSGKKWEISGQIGAAIPSEDDSETGLNLLGRVTYDIAPNIALGVTTGWNGYEVNVDSDDWGDATSVPLLATVVVKIPIQSMENRVVPYLVGGVGVSFWSLDESSLLESNGVSVDEEISFAAQFGAGLDYFFSESLAVFGEISYFMNEVDTEVTAPGVSGTLEGDTDSIFIGGGLKARF